MKEIVYLMGFLGGYWLIVSYDWRLALGLLLVRSCSDLLKELRAGEEK